MDPIIKTKEITLEKVYYSRRKFLLSIGISIAAASAASACERLDSLGLTEKGDSKSPLSGKGSDELGNDLTSLKSVENYNNYYEFTTDKEKVAALSANFKTEPWTLEVGGLVRSPKKYGLDDLERLFPSRESIYRMRCVEGWSMVIPWLGFPLTDLLKMAEPTSAAKYVKFTSILDPEEMPGQKNPFYEWPYVEGMRLDEAMHDLTLISTGLYGKTLPNQNGAPLRLVVPWKYGFKGAKAIVKIDLVKDMPRTFWVDTNAREYGFFANVNPDVPHPRWTQSTERRIGELRRRKTLPFNGYADQVAGLYGSMDLKKFF